MMQLFGCLENLDRSEYSLGVDNALEIEAKCFCIFYILGCYGMFIDLTCMEIVIVLN